MLKTKRGKIEVSLSLFDSLTLAINMLGSMGMTLHLLEWTFGLAWWSMWASMNSTSLWAATEAAKESKDKAENFMIFVASLCIQSEFMRVWFMDFNNERNVKVYLNSSMYSCLFPEYWMSRQKIHFSISIFSDFACLMDLNTCLSFFLV